MNKTLISYAIVCMSAVACSETPSGPTINGVGIGMALDKATKIAAKACGNECRMSEPSTTSRFFRKESGSAIIEFQIISDGSGVRRASETLVSSDKNAVSGIYSQFVNHSPVPLGPAENTEANELLIGGECRRHSQASVKYSVCEKGWRSRDGSVKYQVSLDLNDESRDPTIEKQ